MIQIYYRTWPKLLSKNSDIGSRGDCEKVALLRLRASTYTHTHIHTHTHTHTHLCVYIHTHIFIYICIYVYMYADRSLLKVVLKRALVSRIFWFSDSVFVCRSSETGARISREATSPLKYSDERLTFPMTFVVNYRRRLPTFLYRISCTILVRVSPLQPRLLFSPITR